jgi:hypothetical protein
MNHIISKVNMRDRLKLNLQEEFYHMNYCSFMIRCEVKKFKYQFTHHNFWFIYIVILEGKRFLSCHHIKMKKRKHLTEFYIMKEIPKAIMSRLGQKLGIMMLGGLGTTFRGVSNLQHIFVCLS